MEYLSQLWNSFFSGAEAPATPETPATPVSVSRELQQQPTAAENSHPECMQLAKAWGATAYTASITEAALQTAAENSHPDGIMQLAKAAATETTCDSPDCEMTAVTGSSTSWSRCEEHAQN